ncbi:hypothetical protein [Pseudomonas azerbaijanoccidentalis]
MINATAMTQSLLFRWMQKMFLSPAGPSIQAPTTQPNTNRSAHTQGKDHTIINMGDCASSQLISTALMEHVPNPDKPVVIDIESGLMGTDQTLNEIITTESSDHAVVSADLARTINQLLAGDINAAKDNAPDNSMAKHIAIKIDEMDSSIKTDQSPAATIQRAQTITDTLGELLGKLGRNEFEGDLGRWASNLTISGLRTGLVVGTLTTIRQLIGFALEKSLQSNAASPLTRNVIGAISLMIGPALNIIGAVRDECNGTANTQTRLARLATLTLSMAALATAAAAPQALPALASFGPQMAFYSFATDLVNLFLPISDNSKPNPAGTAATAGLNGALQFLVFTAMSNTAPRSGPGYAMSAGSAPSTASDALATQLSEWLARNVETAVGGNLSAENRATEILESLAPIIGHDVLRGAYNAGADVTSQVLGGEIMHALQSEKSPEGFRVKLMPPRIPTAEQVANQFLTTNAIRTSLSEAIITVVVSASRYFSTLPISKAEVDHIVNALVAAVVFAGRPGVVYANQGTTPAVNAKQV